MKHKLWYSVVVRDRHGKVVSRERRRSRSFLKAWNQGVCVHMSHWTTAGFSIKATDGTSPDVGAYETNFRMTAGSTIDDYGIVVGTGDTAVAIDDYRLEAIIVEGSGADQMNYAGCTAATSVVSAPNCDFLVSRSVVNNSGGVITVKETGIYVLIWTSPTKYFCVIRDVLVAAQNVPDGGAITVEYTIRVTV